MKYPPNRKACVLRRTAIFLFALLTTFLLPAVATVVFCNTQLSAVPWAHPLSLTPSPAVPLQAWRYAQGRLQPLDPSSLSLPPQPAPAPLQADLNRDGLPESLRLSHARLEIVAGDRSVWQSPFAWEVAQAAIADLNQDHNPEAILLVWRPFQPWPVDRNLPNPGRIQGFHDSSGRSCHLILIGWKRGAYRELWAGSALAEPLLAFTLADLNGDGYPELVALESSYAAPRGSPSSALSAWEWNGFGFTLLDRAPGVFRNVVSVTGLDGQVIIVAEKD